MTSFAYFSNERDVRVFKAGDLILAEGDVGDHMFALLEGEVEIRRGEACSRRSPPAASSASSH